LERIFNLQGMEILYFTLISYLIINLFVHRNLSALLIVFCLHNLTKFSHSGARWKM